MIDRTAQAGTPDVPARRLRPGEHEDRARAGSRKGRGSGSSVSVTRRDSVATCAVMCSAVEQTSR